MKRIQDFFKRIKSGMLLSGLSSLALGLVMILVPGFLQGALSLILGGGLCAFGLAEIVFVFVRPNGILSAGRMIPGILALAVGLVFFFQFETFLALIWILVGITMLIDGVYKLQYAFELKSAAVSSWWITLLTSLVALIFAVVLIIRPFDVERTMTVLAGVFLAANGIFDLVTVGMMIGFSEKVRSVTSVEIYDAPEGEVPQIEE
jgi:uncharacterized membrane protein HdeD (DUF308 family)